MQTQKASISPQMMANSQGGGTPAPQAGGGVGNWSAPVNPGHGSTLAKVTERVEDDHRDHVKWQDPHRDCRLCQAASSRAFNGSYTRYGNSSGVGEVVGM